MTTTVQYDLDTSGGLMDEIQALIAPPQTDEPARKYRRIDRETRRTGRTTNRDCCDSCHEGGDLICCDRCPASFHLQCCDPPLEEEDLPTGDWVCHKCTVAPQHIEKSDAEIVAAMTIPKSITLKDENRGTEDKRQRGDYFKPRKTPVRLNDRLRRDGKQCMRLAQLQAYKEAQKEIKIGKKDSQEKPEKTEPDEDDMEEILQSKGNPLLMLIKAASIQNPNQFQLPAEIMTHAPLPGMTRKRRKEEVNKNIKTIYELENGMVPLPAKMCFLCNKSCRVDPLIQCDYCPLLFHRDCLSPPLTTFPTGRWMCPNHPENGLPEFAKASYTEKCKIYHNVNNRINQHAVKMDFLNKVHATGPPLKDKPERRKSSRIPVSIKEHYRHPPSLLRTSERIPSVTSSSVSSRLSTPEEKEEWLKSVISLQSSVAIHLTKKDLSKSEPVTQKIVSATQLLRSETSHEKPAPSHHPTMKLSDRPSSAIREFNHIHNSKQENHIDANSVRTREKTEFNDINRQGMKSELTNGPEILLNGPSDLKNKDDFELHRDLKKTIRAEQHSKDFYARSNSLDKCINEKPVNHFMTAASQSLKSSGVITTQSSGHSLPSSVKMVSSSSTQNLRVTTIMVPGRSTTATSKLMSVHSGNGTDKLTTSSNSASLTDKSISPALLGLNNTLQSCIEGSEDAELSQLDQKLIEVLAWQRLQQLLPSKATPAATTKEFTDNHSDQPPTVPKTDTRTPILGVFCPVSSSNCSKSIKMKRKFFSIGKSSDADMCLSHYGHCNYISAKHASVFYDEASRHFELLNYSEFGTTVDMVSFTGKLVEKSLENISSSSSFVKSVRKLSKRKKVPETPDRRPVAVRRVEIPCRCATDIQSQTSAGWEGTALLHHGSYVKFGCLDFVFSVAEAAALPKSVT